MIRSAATPSAVAAFALIAVLGSMSTAAEHTGPPEKVLRFDSPLQRFAPTAKDSTVIGTFPFTNVSAQRVVVTAKSGCPCLSIAFDHDAYDPGQHGVLVATFSIGLFGGLQIRSVPFATDHSDLPKGSVTMEFHLPPVPAFNLNLLSWTTNAAATPKVFRVTPPAQWGNAITAASTTDPAFNAVLTTDPDGLAYTITVTPLSTQHPATSTIVLQTAGGRTFDLHAVIVTPTTAPAAP